MNPRPIRWIAPGLLSLAGIAAFAGGWATITVEDLPDYVVARQPVTLAFAVRQHGRELLEGLAPSLEARAGELEVRAAATPGEGPGRYRAVLALPQPGDWTITLRSGFRSSKLALLPLKATEPGRPAPTPLPDTERGHRLFVAKGCLTCHLHAEVRGSGAVPVGPELTGRRYPADYLAKFLADPASASPAKGTAKMPDLDLKPREIAALVAFLNTERHALR
ncbi:MAG: cytochrome c [Gemmatimonadetes bacterium]|nr:cytochrome c [Gemmatimonadota bacterium]